VASRRSEAGSRQIVRTPVTSLHLSAWPVGLLGITLLALARPLVDVHPGSLLGAAAVLAAELRGVYPIISF
jgi:hypothetical protein